jgi:hypothetical protein
MAIPRIIPAEISGSGGGVGSAICAAAVTGSSNAARRESRVRPKVLSMYLLFEVLDIKMAVRGSVDKLRTNRREFYRALSSRTTIQIA